MNTDHTDQQKQLSRQLFQEQIQQGNISSQEDISFGNEDNDVMEEEQQQQVKKKDQSEQLGKPKNEINEQKVAELTEENKKQKQIAGLKQREITRLQKKLEQVTKRNAELEISSKTLQTEYEQKVSDFKEKLRGITGEMETKQSKQNECLKQIKEQKETEAELLGMVENYKKMINEKNLQLENYHESSRQLKEKVEEVHQQKVEIMGKFDQLQKDYQNKEFHKTNNIELAQRLFQEIKDLQEKVGNVMSINHDPQIMQKQVQSQMEAFLAEKCKLLNENTLLRGRIEKMKEDKQNQMGGMESSTKMETEENPLNLNKNCTNDPRLQMFMDKFSAFQSKLDEYEKQKFDAIKEKDMWYDKSVQLEKQLEEFQEGNFSNIKQVKKKKAQSKKKNAATSSDSESSQKDQSNQSSDLNSFNSQQNSGKQMEIEAQQPRQKPSLLFNFNKKSKNPFSSSFNSLKICLNCSLIIKKTDKQCRCSTCKSFLHEKCWKKKAEIENQIVNCNSCAGKELMKLVKT